ncbi:nucleotide exchange factor GrpE [Clostridium massiliamazoniense]|uniref:nucleotide exchange factor GrpE n=1 Tax=Clostridium massiliamazoniense TaxID=1347366 RepID=UPI0006D7E91D|nr:nucleotide exchange factor GrpE [Clostridium massiliamazoniense]
MEDNKNGIEDEVLNKEEVLEEEPNVDENSEEVSSEEETEEIDELKELREKHMLFEGKNKKLQNELDTLKDRLLRINAEYENYRKRTDKEKERIYSDACTDVLSKMLPVLDNLERAVLVDGSVEDLKKGVEMTIRQFIDALGKLDVQEIDVSEGFDPNVHEAVMHVQDENFGPNQVAEVFQKGYKRGDKVIRHAMVKVVN